MHVVAQLKNTWNLIPHVQSTYGNILILSSGHVITAFAHRRIIIEKGVIDEFSYSCVTTWEEPAFIHSLVSSALTSQA